MVLMHMYNTLAAEDPCTAEIAVALRSWRRNFVLVKHRSTSPNTTYLVGNTEPREGQIVTMIQLKARAVITSFLSDDTNTLHRRL